ncbi:hypothetical protein L1987_10285 [Smallanthus sonchifolius]|uniref:Uncharacterized protein n=1 Tax=Smallanthus sonchifolius TaxID=185202 RepID=A0ACB9JRP3_9ASTR|nr:hypothetical protein L1987_10285 [Smallanthus sonchifolius]
MDLQIEALCRNQLSFGCFEMVDSKREMENGSSPTPSPQMADVKKYCVIYAMSYLGPTEADVHRNALLETSIRGGSSSSGSAPTSYLGKTQFATNYDLKMIYCYLAV